jgi:alpha-tubulin suppressor-like RCC1 family protein
MTVSPPADAPAQGAAVPASLAAAQLDAGAYHSCATLAAARLRCWGFNGDGQLGYGNRDTIGDDEVPGAAGPVDLGAGRTATAVAAGDFHTCALLDDRSVRCWGYAFDGQLGRGNRDNIGDNEVPAAVAPVDLGGAAVAIAAGGRHTCAVLEDRSVRCWGSGQFGQLGYGNTNNVGDGGRGQNQTPASAGPVDLGGARARAIAAGGSHTCVLLEDGSVRCWGLGANGQLGYGATSVVVDASSAGPVSLGAGRSATAISAGDHHTCAVLDDGAVRCWGFGYDGRLGHAAQADVGDDETPGSVAPVALGGRAVAISAGGSHTCAVLEGGAVRCWGAGAAGRLGSAATSSVGDDETPASLAPVNLGSGRAALAVQAGQAHTCARLDDGSVRCWGDAGAGRLGYCDSDDIGDDELPGAVLPVDLEAPSTRCSMPDPGAGGDGGVPAPPAAAAPSATLPGGAASVDPLAAQARRARDLRRCLARAARADRRARAAARRTCFKRHGRTPGRIRGLRARRVSRTTIELSFAAPGSDGNRSPAASTYIIRQALRPIRDARVWARAPALCRKGICRFTGVRVGRRITLRVTDLRPRTTYHYAVAARDNVSGRRGPRSISVKVTTR